MLCSGSASRHPCTHLLPPHPSLACPPWARRSPEPCLHLLLQGRGRVLGAGCGGLRPAGEPRPRAAAACWAALAPLSAPQAGAPTVPSHRPVWNGLALCQSLVAPLVVSCQALRREEQSRLNEPAGGVQRPLGAVGHPAVTLAVPVPSRGPCSGEVGQVWGPGSLLAVGTWGVTASGPLSGVGPAPTSRL